MTIAGQVQWLIAFLDDASRFMTCWGLVPSATAEATSMLLETECARYGIPNEILTGHGTQFVSNQRADAPNHAFEQFLEGHTIRYIVARRGHPQTNGGGGRGRSAADRGRIFRGGYRRLAEQNQNPCDFEL